MSFTRSEPALARVIEDPEQLVEYFRVSEKPEEQHRVGTEAEKIGVYLADASPIPYDGPRGIGALLAKLAAHHEFETMVEGENLLGLASGEATITLEPGGQLELSGAPQHSLHATCAEFNDHIALVNSVSEEMGIAWLGLGVHPLAAVDQIPHMPRERHALMRSFLAPRGSLAMSMMHATAGVQANFDYSSERDAAAKLRFGLAASPVVVAMYANSPISLGRPNGFESWRAQIWRDTDPARCGLLPFAFSEDFEERGAYRAYTEWALDVPLFFVVRDQHHIPVGGRTFRQLLESGEGELRPTLGDWHVHLTTLFPEVRLKRVIEVRSADAVPAPLVCALPAFWKGLLYDPATLQAAQKRLMHWRHADVDALHADAARRGLQARSPDGPVLEVARELLELSDRGLARIQARERHGGDERALLEPLRELLDLGHSPGREILNRWDGPLQRSVTQLLRDSRYGGPPR